MKKLILLLSLAFVMCGCHDDKVVYTKSQRTTLEVGVFEYDSCEYITLYSSVAHKGNCKFCAERKRKEYEKLIRRLKED